jgi:hypothetical protein
MVFSKKDILITNVAEKNILILTNWRVDVFLKSSNDLLSFNHAETSLIILLLIFFFFSKKNNELKIIKYSSISFYKTKSNIYITYVQSSPIVFQNFSENSLSACVKQNKL